MQLRLIIGAFLFAQSSALALALPKIDVELPTGVSRIDYFPQLNAVLGWGHYEPTIHVYDVATGMWVTPLVAADDPCGDASGCAGFVNVVVSANGDKVAAGGRGAGVWVWDFATRSQTHFFTDLYRNQYMQVAIDPDGTEVTLVSPLKIRFADLATSTIVDGQTSTFHFGFPSYSADGSEIRVVAHHQGLRRFDRRTREMLAVDGNIDGPYRMDATGQRVATLSYGQVEVANFSSSGRPTFRTRYRSYEDFAIDFATELVATARTDGAGEVVVWDMGTGNFTHREVFDGLQDFIWYGPRQLLVIAKGRLATVELDRLRRAWQMEIRGASDMRLEMGTGTIAFVDGWDDVTYRLDTLTGITTEVLPANGSSALLSQDGRLVATGASNRVILRSLDGSHSCVSDGLGWPGAFSADGRLLFAWNQVGGRVIDTSSCITLHSLTLRDAETTLNRAHFSNADTLLVGGYGIAEGPINSALLRRIDIATGRETGRFDWPGANLMIDSEFQPVPQSEHVAFVVGSNQTARELVIFDWQTMRAINSRPISGYSATHRPFAFSADGQRLALLKTSFEVGVYDLASDVEIDSYSLTATSFFDLLFDQTGRILYFNVHSGGGPLTAWEFERHEH